MGDFKKLGRRKFLTFACGTGVLSLLPITSKTEPIEGNTPAKKVIPKTMAFSISSKRRLDLSPASWIWYPSERVLPNSFFHFRKSFTLSEKPSSMEGWILGDSRYLLEVNGKRVQWGPAPSDPRFSEADPMNLEEALQAGENIIAVTVLFYGFGDGTWPTGKAGFIFKLQMNFQNTGSLLIVSDDSWKVRLGSSWRPGQYKRWYLRALQESFDNRQYPHGWQFPKYVPDKTWKKAMIVPGPSDQTSLSTAIPDYMNDSSNDKPTQLRARSIPLLKEEVEDSPALVESHVIRWNVQVEEYFDIKTQEAYHWVRDVEIATVGKEYVYEGTLAADEGLVLSFVFPVQIVGWPFFNLECQAGTVVEIMIQQGHVLKKEGGPELINNNFHSWTRFTAKEGENTFTCFDYESVKWLQLHFHHTSGPIRIKEVGVLKRLYPFAASPKIETSSATFDKLLKACHQTVLNNSQDLIVDCMGRERQQYSGDIGHMVHALNYGYQAPDLTRRFVQTFGQGMTLDGFFMDSWPAFDRLNRIPQRHLGLTPWGVLLDHSIGFCFDCWHHYLYSGNLEDLEEVFPNLLKFFRYLQSSLQANGLLPVEDLGIAAVWMDTDSYVNVRDKQCAYNLYAASMMKQAFAPLAEAFGESDIKEEALAMSKGLVSAIRSHFWDEEEGLLVVNRPWLKEDQAKRTCERSLAHYVLGGFSSTEEREVIAEELTQQLKRLGRCYPANTVWLHWTLSYLGLNELILEDFEKRWLEMYSVQHNGTIQEAWVATPDSTSQMSHAGIAPMFAAYMGFAGISILAPGAKEVLVRPQMSDLEMLKLSYQTVRGPIVFDGKGKKGRRNIRLSFPEDMKVFLDLDSREKAPKGCVEVASALPELKRYLVQGQSRVEVRLRYS